MNSQDIDSEGISASHGRPCVGCRKRKVRCDKVRPCSNCTRSKQLCTYEGSDGISGIGREFNVTSPSTDGELRERLARLEKLMGEFARAPARLATGSPETIANQSLNGRADTSPDLLSTTTHQFPRQYHPPPSTHLQQHAAVASAPRGNDQVGQVVFQDGYSAYFDADFWPGLITEVEDLRQLFDGSSFPSSQWTSMSMLGVASPFSGADLILAYPTLDESNLLCKYFFECANPFTRAIHSSLFARELGMYRRGTFQLPKEFEALLFSIYTLTVNSLRPEVVEQAFSTSKDVLLSRFQLSTQIALAKIDFHKTDKINGLSALIHYVTFLFQQNLYRDATSLLAVATRVAQSMGIHRDSRHFPYSEWVVEIRSRLWNQICCLDAQAITCYGAESCLPASSDALPPRNANDRDWHASRFAKPSSVPRNVLGITDTTFVIVHRDIANATRLLSRIDSSDLDEKCQILRETGASVSRYLTGVDATNPSHTVIAAVVEVKLSTLRLSVRHRKAENEKASQSDPQRQQVFLAALELLEAIEYHCTSFASFNWEWVFATTVPWLATAIALTHQQHTILQSDRDRAHRQIENVFKRFSHPALVASTPMWQILVRLRQNMQDGSSHGIQVLPTASMPGDQSGMIRFDDDLMLDFGQQTGGSDPLGFDDPLMAQDLQNMPWYAWQPGESA